MTHFILDNAKRYDEPNGKIAPDNAAYDAKAGYWTEDFGSNPLINSDRFQNMSTKKEDRETGEDQKGE